MFSSTCFSGMTGSQLTLDSFYRIWQQIAKKSLRL
uniref:Uncharacterized protein n=1 Tax=Rhizophora mucronata TaxID=61149 RepID=A0A2P2QT06_RHIMU